MCQVTKFISAGWDLLEALAWHFLGVESCGKSLEELDEVYNAVSWPRGSVAKPNADDLQFAALSSICVSQEADHCRQRRGGSHGRRVDVLNTTPRDRLGQNQLSKCLLATRSFPLRALCKMYFVLGFREP